MQAIYGIDRLSAIRHERRKLPRSAGSIDALAAIEGWTLGAEKLCDAVPTILKPN
jgi:hypothetical protein